METCADCGSPIGFGDYDHSDCSGKPTFEEYLKQQRLNEGANAPSNSSLSAREEK